VRQQGIQVFQAKDCCVCAQRGYRGGKTGGKRGGNAGRCEKTYLIEEPIAAAIGAGIDISKAAEAW